ncbi:protealysin inhibitor emfourin [Brevibacterium renqingii]|uniref:protealysin inhibitor emfourin n=1 Tax=Brevibacterium renqingii TaxID=2776916 RepID=UPI001ADF3C43|nr:protealysin inhibitor emfourin [Brevibacterium renqingii]
MSSGGSDAGQPPEQAGDGGGYGRLIVERSGGIAGMLMVWELDIDSSGRRDEIGRQVAELPWTDAARAAEASGADDSGAAGSAGADRFAYLIESRYGSVRFGEGQMPQEWRRLVDEVRESPEAHRRRPGRG